ncbi:MAG: hypothetical protein IKK43_03225 [Clostridia bacterium]|nr:hypothetical protein [Clostridia bacterium]
MNNKGINMITLIITIIIIIILSSITIYHTTKTTSDATKKNVMEEMKNVEDVIGIAKAKGMIGEFIPNSLYKISDEQLDSKYKGILTADQIQTIKDINNDDTVDPLRKYYLLDQSGFDSEFRNNDIASVSGLKREYLVSYQDRVVIVIDNGSLISSGKIDSTQPTNSEIKVVFTPNGNKEWARSHSAEISVTGENINSMSYAWTKTAKEPASIDINNNFSGNTTVSLVDETGNNWYIWVLVTYTEDDVQKQYIQRSNAFYIDNTPPSGELEVNEVKK